METQKILTSQNNLEKEEQSWRLSQSLISNYVIKLQSSKQYDTGTDT